MAGLHVFANAYLFWWGSHNGSANRVFPIHYPGYCPNTRWSQSIRTSENGMYWSKFARYTFIPSRSLEDENNHVNSYFELNNRDANIRLSALPNLRLILQSWTSLKLSIQLQFWPWYVRVNSFILDPRSNPISGTNWNSKLHGGVQHIVLACWSRTPRDYRHGYPTGNKSSHVSFAFHRLRKRSGTCCTSKLVIRTSIFTIFDSINIQSLKRLCRHHRIAHCDMILTLTSVGSSLLEMAFHQAQLPRTSWFHSQEFGSHLTLFKSL